jgi:hypothetical protein
VQSYSAAARNQSLTMSQAACAATADSMRMSHHNDRACALVAADHGSPRVRNEPAVMLWSLYYVRHVKAESRTLPQRPAAKHNLKVQ